MTSSGLLVSAAISFTSNADVLEARDRTVAGVTAEPDGLYLVNVEYPERYLIPKPKKLIDNFKFSYLEN